MEGTAVKEEVEVLDGGQGGSGFGAICVEIGFGGVVTVAVKRSGQEAVVLI